MDEGFLVVVRIVFAALFVVTLVVGAYILYHFQRFFGVDKTMPSENSSSRTYSKLQVVMVWIHLLALTGAFALLLH